MCWFFSPVHKQASNSSWVSLLFNANTVYLEITSDLKGLGRSSQDRPPHRPPSTSFFSFLLFYFFSFPSFPFIFLSLSLSLSLFPFFSSFSLLSLSFPLPPSLASCFFKIKWLFTRHGPWLLMPVKSPRLFYLCLWLTNCKSRPPQLYLGLVNLLGWLTEIRETLTYVYWLIIEAISKDADEEVARVRYGGRNVELPSPLPVCHLPGTSRCSATWKLWTQSFWIFVDASLCKHDCWNH